MSRIRQVQHRLVRGLLHRLVPLPDASPGDGGQSAHPLGACGALPLAPSTIPLAEHGELAQLAGAGSAEISTRLQQALDTGTPGEGPAWSDVAMVASRLIHLAAVQAWAAPDGLLGRTLAGHARFHVVHLVREHPFDDGQPTTTLCYAALLIASFAWPELAETRRWRGPAFAGLGHSLPGLLGADGAPPVPLGPSTRALWASCLARAWADANQLGFPSDADSALLQGVNAVWRICGDTGRPPGEADDTPAILPLGEQPAGHIMRNLVLAWGLDEGAAGVLPDPVCQQLTGCVPSESPIAMAQKQWALWTWRDSGMCVAHSLIRKQPSRFWCHRPDATLQWEVGSQLVVRGSSVDRQLHVARVDGPAVRIVYQSSEGRRTALLRQARLQVVDEGQQEVSWALDQKWELTPTEKGFAGKIGRLQLLIKTDPAWRWTLSPPDASGLTHLRGVGESLQVKSIFEVR